MDDLSERLLTHFVGGRWRVPFATEQVPVLRADGTRAGSVVAAGPRDIRRARSLMRSPDAAARRRLADVLEPLSPVTPEGLGQIPAGPAIIALESTDHRALAAALGAGLEHGIILAPTIDTAIFATHLTERLQQADLPPGVFAMLHGYSMQTASTWLAQGLPVLRADHK